jgi:hypothetical protein
LVSDGASLDHQLHDAAIPSNRIRRQVNRPPLPWRPPSLTIKAIRKGHEQLAPRQITRLNSEPDRDYSISNQIPKCWRRRRIDPVTEISLTRADSLLTTTFTRFVLTEGGLIPRQHVGQFIVGVNILYQEGSAWSNQRQWRGSSAPPIWIFTSCSFLQPT